MNNLHPDWDTTDHAADEQPVPVRVKQATQQVTPRASQKKKQSVNRFPAAVVGIIAIVGTGFLVFDGMDALIGQTVTNAQDVHIRADGLDPSTVTVMPGERIRWINDSDIPHILASEELLDAEGDSFETIAIFPGSDYTFDLPSTTQPGMYDYVSRTSPSVNGMIDVTSLQTVPVGMQTSSVAAPVMPVSKASSSVSTQAAAPASVGGIPTNPYAITKTNYTDSPSSTGLPVTATVTTHRPVTQPSSGMGMWLAGIAGLAAFLFVLKKSSVRL